MARCKVTLTEYMSYLPRFKPLRGTLSFKFTMKHLEKRSKTLKIDQVAVRGGCKLEFKRDYTGGGGGHKDHREATYQIVLSAKDPSDSDTPSLRNLYFDVKLPPGTQVTFTSYYSQILNLES